MAKSTTIPAATRSATPPPTSDTLPGCTRPAACTPEPPASRHRSSAPRAGGADEPDVLMLLGRVRRVGWNGPDGTALLREAERVARPLARNVARRHRLPLDAISNAALTAAWVALDRYDPAKSPDPRGWLALVARRAAVDEALLLSSGYGARNRARLAAAIIAATGRLTDELGREPVAVEVRGRLSRAMRQEADRCGASADLATFLDVGRPELTGLSGVDEPEGPCPTRPVRACPRLAAAARAVAARCSIAADRLDAAANLAADLAADLIPRLGILAARRRVIDELAHSPAPIRLPRPVGEQLFDELLSVVLGGVGDPPSAA